MFSKATDWSFYSIFKSELISHETLVVVSAYCRSIINSLSLFPTQVDVVVATPGRLGDMVSTGALSLSHCRFFILDECDGLLSAGNGQLINRLYDKCPKITPDGLHRLQMIVCSATLHSFEVKKLAVSWATLQVVLDSLDDLFVELYPLAFSSESTDVFPAMGGFEGSGQRSRDCSSRCKFTLIYYLSLWNPECALQIV